MRTQIKCVNGAVSSEPFCLLVLRLQISPLIVLYCWNQTRNNLFLVLPFLLSFHVSCYSFETLSWISTLSLYLPLYTCIISSPFKTTVSCSSLLSPSLYSNGLISCSQIQLKICFYVFKFWFFFQIHINLNWMNFFWWNWSLMMYF